MLKNCVFKVSVDTKEWFKAAGKRMIKTGAQTALAGITTGAAMSDINWALILSTAGVAMIASVLTSIVGLPEAPANKLEAKE